MFTLIETRFKIDLKVLNRAPNFSVTKITLIIVIVILILIIFIIIIVAVITFRASDVRKGDEETLLLKTYICY